MEFFFALACDKQDIVVKISVQCMCIVRLFAFVRAISSTFMHGFQNNLAQLFSLRSKSAFGTFVWVG